MTQNDPKSTHFGSYLDLFWVPFWTQKWPKIGQNTEKPRGPPQIRGSQIWPKNGSKYGHIWVQNHPKSRGQTATLAPMAILVQNGHIWSSKVTQNRVESRAQNLTTFGPLLAREAQKQWAAVGFWPKGWYLGVPKYGQKWPKMTQNRPILGHIWTQS